MSKQVLDAFLAKVKQDNALFAKVKAIPTADQQAAIAQLVKVAAAAGFSLSVDEVTALVEGPDVVGQSGGIHGGNQGPGCLLYAHNPQGGGWCICDQK
jgi:predicted ribosomally synthesized peptide with nif11-like leader